MGGLKNIQDKPARRRDGARQIVSDMSEAVSYLIGVALSAGLGDVARKLNDVNMELRCMQLRANKNEQTNLEGTVKH